MSQYSFMDDYSEGCHPNILSALTETNLIQQTAYGDDEYSFEAKQLIKQQLNHLDSEVWFVSGGTQANLTIMSAVLRPHQAVISADTGHILVRETGAIEATGHKIISVASSDGKLTPSMIQQVLDQHVHAPHMVQPKLVYISNASEVGTIYNKAELQQLRKLCDEKELILFMDGARLGSALTSHKNDLTLTDLAHLTDIFYIGGTKNGALLGEAIVINNLQLNKDFAFSIKQRGALLSKGRLLGIQFKELFSDNLYFDLAAKANHLTQQLAQAFKDAGYQLASEPETNQLFPILPDHLIEQLEQDFRFYVWAKHSETESVIRMVTSWATPQEQIDRFIATLKS